MMLLWPFLDRRAHSHITRRDVYAFTESGRGESRGKVQKTTENAIFCGDLLCDKYQRLIGGIQSF